jgi:5'-nucleotidase (lipoprotein e(P4) family)
MGFMEPMVKRTFRPLVAAAVVVVLVSCAARRAPVAGTVSARCHEPSVPRDTHENLNPILWMQTAVEYQMLTEGIYARARQLLDDNLARARTDPSWTAATEQSGDLSSLERSAVVMDLDETVMDNSPYEAEQIARECGQFDPALWRIWTSRRSARAIAGAIGFIEHARARGVRVFFITGRSVETEDDTVANLRELGLAVDNDDVLTEGEGDWKDERRDKTFRRSAVAEGHRILLMVGDDLRDFVSANGLAPDQRLALARKYQSYWTDRWVVLPNPLYGGWETSVRDGAGPRGTSDAEILAYKRSLLRRIQ